VGDLDLLLGRIEAGYYDVQVGHSLSGLNAVDGRDGKNSAKSCDDNGGNDSGNVNGKGSGHTGVAYDMTAILTNLENECQKESQTELKSELNLEPIKDQREFVDRQETIKLEREFTLRSFISPSSIISPLRTFQNLYKKRIIEPERLYLSCNLCPNLNSNFKSDINSNVNSSLNSCFAIPTFLPNAKILKLRAKEDLQGLCDLLRYTEYSSLSLENKLNLLEWLSFEMAGSNFAFSHLVSTVEKRKKEKLSLAKKLAEEIFLAEEASLAEEAYLEFNGKKKRKEGVERGAKGLDIRSVRTAIKSANTTNLSVNASANANATNRLGLEFGLRIGM
jgi:hypothetical protein